MKITQDTLIGDIALGIDSAIDIFVEKHINYGLDPGQTLQDACLQAGEDMDEVLALLNKLDPRTKPEEDWADRSIYEIVQHLAQRQHPQIRMRMNVLCKKSAELNRLGQGHPELFAQLDEFLKDMRDKMEAHMAEEEDLVFPYLKQRAGAEEGDGTEPLASQGHLFATIHWKHQAMWDQWVLLRTLLSNYRFPGDASRTFEELCLGLRDLEEYVQQHGHLEDNILFRKARNMGLLD